MTIEAVRTLITDKVKGRVIDFVGIQGNQLVIATKDGQSYRLGWRDADNELVPGSPSLEGIDCSVRIEGFGLTGTTINL